MKTMKRARYLFAFLAAAVLAFALAGTALAVNNPSEPSITIKTTSTTDEAYTDTTAYTWYRIMEADIDVDPTQHGTSQIGGEVAYYVTTSDRATQLEHTDLFNVKRVGTEDKWYVELKNPESTSASQIEAAFEAATFDLNVFPSGNFAQTAVAGEATYPTTGTIPAGYYYVTSTAGTNAVIQTLAAVTIDEKNTFPPVTKAVDQHDVEESPVMLVKSVEFFYKTNRRSFELHRHLFKDRFKVECINWALIFLMCCGIYARIR